jgi:hypothetical protein
MGISVRVTGIDPGKVLFVLDGLRDLPKIQDFCFDMGNVIEFEQGSNKLTVGQWKARKEAINNIGKKKKTKKSKKSKKKKKKSKSKKSKTGAAAGAKKEL